MRREVPFRVKGARHTLGARTWIMGVVNVTLDSFYDGGQHFDPQAAAAHGFRLAEEGADILDIGGESSRPGAEPVPMEEELGRVIPVVRGLRLRTKALISVDTTKSEVARAALDAGADIINDISAFSLDTGLLKIVAESGAGLVLMHMKGTPRTMQANPRYDDVVAEVRSFLEEKMTVAQAYGVPAESIVLDPGIGFGKRLEDNLSLLNHLGALADLGRPLLIGVSRKAFIGKILNLPVQERLEGTIGASVVGIVRGAHILRVHDVKAVRQAAAVADAVLAAPAAGPDETEGRDHGYVQ